MSKSNGNDPSRQDKTPPRRRSPYERIGPYMDPVDPVHYPRHPYASMERFAKLLGLRYERARTRHSYFRDMRLSECLRLSIHDIDGDGRKLWVREGKGGRDRMVPLSQPMLEELRAYWKFHHHPYFMVTFTLPEPLRALFAGRGEDEAYRAFFAAASQALREVLANPRWLGAAHSGFTCVLQTWGQQLQFHPHIHAIVPGAGEAADGRVVTVQSSAFLVPQPVLRLRFRTLMRRLCEHLPGAPAAHHPVWQQDWGADIRPFGDGANIVRYLGRYVCKTAIGDSRIIAWDDETVTFA